MSQLTTAGGREFQVVGAAQLKDRFLMLVHLFNLVLAAIFSGAHG